MQKTTQQFINELQSIFGNLYDYSKVQYINNCTKVTIICPIHGEFQLTPQCLLRGHKCPKCRKQELSQQQYLSFLNKAKEIHGDKYDYSKVKYVNCTTKVCIICPQHGEFWQTPRDHLQGCGCKKCKTYTKYTLQDFISKANLIHNNKYDYSKVEYVDTNTPICIICPIHGEFWQTPERHFYYGCRKCGVESSANTRRDTKESFIEKARKVHHDSYDYSEIEYVNSQTPIKIRCPLHGYFYQTPNHHLNGRKCPICQESELEHTIRLFLESKNILFEWQKKFDWLGKMSLDFYLPDYNAAIECQGRQHFEEVSRFGGNEAFTKQVESDQKKLNLCIEHKIKLYYYSELKIEYPYLVFTNKENLLNSIMN